MAPASARQDLDSDLRILLAAEGEEGKVFLLPFLGSDSTSKFLRRSPGVRRRRLAAAREEPSVFILGPGRHFRATPADALLC